MSLVVARAFGLCTIQDLGRPGHMHAGLPRGGALVPALLARANRAVRNPDGAAAIEIQGRLVVRAEAPIDIATDAGARSLAAGEELVVTSDPRRVAYLAFRGGVDAPLVLGGCGAHLTAGIGALLAAGAQLSAGGAPITDMPPGSFVDRTTIRVVPGPDAGAFDRDALAILAAAPYRILPASDRVGTRLAGAGLPRTDAPERSRPMVRGAIEVPRDGQPIVLGPEHPTTGGYPVIAVIAADDLDAFHALRLGASVAFVISCLFGAMPIACGTSS